MTRWLHGLALVAGLAGCSRAGVVVFPLLDTADPGEPVIEVSPTQLSFEASAEPQFDTFSIGNVGDAPLELLELTLEGDTSFALLGEAPPTTIQPGTSAEVVVQYDASDSWSTASIWLRSDDPSNPIEQVSLEGTPIAPDLHITPSSVDFGELTPGCEAEQELVLINLGKAELELQNLQYSTDNQWLRITQAPDLPLTLDPGDATTITVAFAPTDEGEDSGSLLIFSSDPDAIAEVTQQGSAAWSWQAVKGYELLPVDLVMAVDHSASMVSVLHDLKNYTDELVEALDEAGLDWRASVVARGDACVHAGPVGPEDAGADAAIASGLTELKPWQATDRLLQLLQTTVLRADEGDCNEGLIRDDAVLHGVVIANGPHVGPESWEYYVQELQELMGPSERLRISAIVGDLPTGCPGAGAGTGYDSAVEATGGRFLSICTELDRLDELAEASRRAVVRLPSDPDPETLTVTVDGVGWTDGWELDSNRGLIVFEVQPADGQVVQVNYGEAACE